MAPRFAFRFRHRLHAQRFRRPAARSGISTDEAQAIELIDPALYNTGLAPVVGITAEGLRRRFRQTLPWTHEMLGDQQFEDLSNRR